MNAPATPSRTDDVALVALAIQTNTMLTISPKEAHAAFRRILHALKAAEMERDCNATDFTDRIDDLKRDVARLEAQLSAVREIVSRLVEAAKGATKAPWKLWAMSVFADPVGNSNLDDGVPVADTYFTDERGMPRTFNASFIAEARNAIGPLARALGLETDNG